MAEVAGTAVGIISLGIQICQGLVSFYHKYKDQDEIVSGILQDLLLLNNGLEIIHSCISKDTFQRTNGAPQVEDSIIACAAAVAKLESLLGKCHQTAVEGVPTNFALKGRIQILTQKVTFPFRQSTIQELRTTVKNLQSNVIVSLQALQLELNSDLPETTSELLERLKSASDTIVQVQNDVAELGNQVGGIRGSLPELTNSTKDLARVVGQGSSWVADGLTTVDQSISTLSQQINAMNMGLEQNFSTIRRNLDPSPVMMEDTILVALDRYFSNRADSAMSQCSPLEASQAKALQIGLLQRPHMLRSCCDRATLVENVSYDEMLKTSTSSANDDASRPKSAYPFTPYCSCNTESTYQSYARWYGSFRFFQSSLATCIHRHDCPLGEATKRKATMGLSYPFRWRYLSRLLGLSMSITFGAGGLSIAPSLTFCSIVSDDSPAFRLIKSRFRYYGKGDATDSNRESITQELFRLFEERKASPSDINSRGETLLHVVCKSALGVVRDECHIFEEFRELVLSLRHWNVRLNEADIYGNLPLDMLLNKGVLTEYHEGVLSLSLDIFEKGMEFSEAWWPKQEYKSARSWDQYTRHIAVCLVRYCLIDQVIDGLQCGPLSRAILQRSSILVSQMLERFPGCLDEKNIVGHTPMHLAADWSEGISLLLEAGAKYLIDIPDNVGFLPLAYASYSKCLSAVQLFLDADCALHSELPDTGGHDYKLEHSADILWDALISSSETIVKMLVQALVARRRRLAFIASQELCRTDKERLGLLSHNVLDLKALETYTLLMRKGIQVPCCLLVPRQWKTIYHSILKQGCHGEKPPESPAKWAELFWDAGFRDIDEIILTFPTDSTRVYVLDLEVFLDTFPWFLKKGAKLGRKDLRRTDDGEFVPHTPLALYVSRAVVPLLLYNPRVISFTWKFKLESVLAQVLCERTLDDCECACSLGGCSAITAMLKEFGEHRDGFEQTPQIFSGLFNWLIALLDSLTGGWCFFQASIIRFLTFNRLELTHTCCEWYDGDPGYFAIFDQDDRIEIQEEEVEDLKKLFALTAEFQAVYLDMKIPLLQFIIEYWEPRMKSVMNCHRAINENDAGQLRDLGVTWEPREPVDSRFLMDEPLVWFELDFVESSSEHSHVRSRRRKSI